MFSFQVTMCLLPILQLEVTIDTLLANGLCSGHLL